MATFLTGDVIADRMLAHLTDEVTFIPRINSQYSSEFAGKGARVGSSVRVRKPQRAKIRYGRIMDETPINDQYINVNLDDQIGVDVGANSADLALNIDDFDAQYIKPFARDLAVAIDAWAIRKVLPQVPETVGDLGAITMDKVLQAGERLDYNLAPKADRTLLVTPGTQRQAVTAFSGLFNNQATIGKQYTRGRMANDTLGFDWYSSTMLPTLTRGTANGGYLVNGANQSGSSLTVDGGTGTIKKGDTFTIAGVLAVHPQTKESLGYPREFTVTADYTPGGAGTLQITPALVPSGTEQNVTAAPADNVALTVEGASGGIYEQNLAFARDLAYFVTADMPLPKNMEAAGQRTLDGIRLRYIQGYDITNDRWQSRFDIIAGAGILYPEYGVRLPIART